jgi:hypothetical protein
MKRALSVLALMAGLLLLSAIAAAAQGPVRSDTLYAGIYRLRVDRYSDPPFSGQRFDFDAVVSSDAPKNLRDVTLTALAIPNPGTKAATLKATLVPAGSIPGGFKGYVKVPVRGEWTLQFIVSGPLGSNAVGMPLQVSAPAAIPIEAAWAIALAPLLGLLGFFLEQRSYLARLQRSVSGSPGVASAPGAT